MENLKSVDAFRTLRQISQIFGVFGLNNSLRPESRQARHGIEPLQVLQAGTGLVVISAHDAADVLADPSDHRVGIGAITYQVATADDPIVAGTGVFQHRAKRFPIGVNVTED